MYQTVIVLPVPDPDPAIFEVEVAAPPDAPLLWDEPQAVELRAKAEATASAADLRVRMSAPLGGVIRENAVSSDGE